MVKALNGDKANRSRWLFHGLFPNSFGCIEGSNYDSFHEFRSTGNFEKNLKVTFIVLIRKKSGEVDVKEFRTNESSGQCL